MVDSVLRYSDNFLPKLITKILVILFLQLAPVFYRMFKWTWGLIRIWEIIRNPPRQHYNTSLKFWDQLLSPPPRYCQCCLQVTETVSWREPWCWYSSNMLQHWVQGGTWLISEKWTIPELPGIVPGINLFSIIYVFKSYVFMS